MYNPLTRSPPADSTCAPSGPVPKFAMRTNVKLEMLRWAHERAGLEVDELCRRFPRYPAWEKRRATTDTPATRRIRPSRPGADQRIISQSTAG